MKDVIPYYKNRGETPKEALERLRIERPKLQNETLSYAGRLDPLAEGVLLILVGEANKEREQYLHLSKKYTVEILFGWSTDTYDVAGKLCEVSEKHINPLPLMEALHSFEGVHEKEYPPFSSKPVEGHPLFWWAQRGRLSEITIPKHTIEIQKVLLLKTKSITGDELSKFVHKSLGLLTGDFRQDEIWACWEENLKATYNKEYSVVVIEVMCGSGAYMRQLAKELGEKLGVPALALSITRTKIGEFSI